MSYTYKPSGRQADELAGIARELSIYAKRPIGLSEIYHAIGEQAVAEYNAQETGEYYSALELYLKRPMRRSR